MRNFTFCVSSLVKLYPGCFLFKDFIEGSIDYYFLFCLTIWLDLKINTNAWWKIVQSILFCEVFSDLIGRYMNAICNGHLDWNTSLIVSIFTLYFRFVFNSEWKNGSVLQYLVAHRTVCLHHICSTGWFQG